jgi:hypothetical protein
MNRNIIRFFGIGIAVVALSGCAVFGEYDIGQKGRNAARGALTAYELAQQGALIYGSLPLCKPDTPLVKICRSKTIWRKIQVAEDAATTAVVAAGPVLRGDKQDVGEIADVITKVAAVGAELSAAHKEMGK